MSSNGNTHIVLPGQRSPQQGLSAAQREEERQALTAHVDVLTLHVNEVTKACEALIQAQRQNEQLIADLTSGLAGTNLQLSQALDRLTALDSHEDRLEALVRVADGQLSREKEYNALTGDLQRRLDGIEIVAAVKNASFMARLRWFLYGIE